jgi:hypothetical protein
MGAMFAEPRTPQPAPLPPSPLDQEVKAAERKRAADTAVQDAAMSGRRTNTYAGSAIAMEKQMARAKRRMSGEDLGAL